ncbi:MAG: Uma2 family endonuclease [Microcystis aeruginosa BS13-02]|nr:Uma2 family endonuclease [Microcystis aeruginosa BS13-02]
MMTVVEIKFESWQLSDEQFFQLCQDNRDLRLERSAKGDLIIMPPTGGETGNSNAGITAQLWLWNKLPLSPDFVIELMSPSDSLETARKKMQEYLDNGSRLGWLINRKTREVEIYRQGQAVEILANPESLSEESILSQFVLDLAFIW